MKTLTQNNNSKISKSLLTFILITLLTVSNSFAFAHGNEKKADPESKETIENVEEFDELLASLEIEEFEFSITDDSNAFQIIDENDKILFSGSEKEWKNQSNKKLVIMKRKAELLFESNGSKIYKVF